MIELAAAVLALAAGSPPPQEEDPGPPAVVSAATFSPRAHFFGDVLEARLDLVVDASRVDPDSVAVRPRFFPYERVGPRRVSRTAQGRRVRLSYVYPVSCMAPVCVRRTRDAEGHAEASSHVRLDPVRVTYRLAAGGRQASKDVPWQSGTLSSRLRADALEFRSTFGGPLEIVPLRAETTPPPETYRVTPLVAAAALGGVALLALAGALALAAPLVPRRRPKFLEAPQRTPLEEALDLVASVSANGAGGAEHREALERLAEELGAAGLTQYTGRARRLAWSSEPPGREPSLELVRDVRHALAGGGS